MLIGNQPCSRCTAHPSCPQSLQLKTRQLRQVQNGVFDQVVIRSGALGLKPGSALKDAEELILLHRLVNWYTDFDHSFIVHCSIMQSACNTLRVIHTTLPAALSRMQYSCTACLAFKGRRYLHGLLDIFTKTYTCIRLHRKDRVQGSTCYEKITLPHDFSHHTQLQ